MMQMKPITVLPLRSHAMAWDPQPRHEFDQTWSNWLKNFAFGTEIILLLERHLLKYL